MNLSKSGDLRCANILITKHLETRVSDFGVSIWKQDRFNKTNPPFYKAKDVYDVEDVKETLDVRFDIRFNLKKSDNQAHWNRVRKDVVVWRRCRRNPVV